MAVSPRRSSGPVLRSLSPSRRFHPSSPQSSSSSSTSFSSSSSTSRFSSRFPGSFHRSSSPTRFNLSGPTVRSPNQGQRQRRTCTCSPTTHPGSFRCGLHKSFYRSRAGGAVSHTSTNRLSSAGRSAITNSLVRLGTVEGGDLVKRALYALILPSSHQQRRRDVFRPRPSRLSVMSRTEDLV